MITSYILILCLSVWLAVMALAYVGGRLHRVLKGATAFPDGISLLGPVLVFLVVVAASPSMLVGCALLAGAHLTRSGAHLPRIARFGTPIIASLLALSTLPIVAIGPVPATAVYAIAALVMVAMLIMADRLPASVTLGGTGLLLSLLPLIAAPLMGAPSYIALDIALVASGLLAAQMSAVEGAQLRLARQPLVLILGWLMVEAALHGAWVPTMVSLLVYGAFVAYALSTPHDTDVMHAV